MFLPLHDERKVCIPNTPVPVDHDNVTTTLRRGRVHPTPRDRTGFTGVERGAARGWGNSSSPTWMRVVTRGSGRDAQVCGELQENQRRRNEGDQPYGRATSLNPENTENTETRVILYCLCWSPVLREQGAKVDETSAFSPHTSPGTLISLSTSGKTF